MNITQLPTTRPEAIAAGSRFYNTGEPCKNGHSAKRYTHCSSCATCKAEGVKKARQKRKSAKSSELPKTWKEAQQTGSLRYFTGIPCKKGHVAERATSNGGCVICMKERHTKTVSKKSDDPKMILREHILAKANNPVSIDDLINELTDYKPKFVKYEIDVMLRGGAALERLKNGKVLSKLVVDADGRPVFGKSRNMTWFNNALAGARNRLGVG